MKRFLLLTMGLIFLFLSIAKGEPYKGYRGYLNIDVGDAYNFNTSQIISTNNMQWYTEIATTHGYVINNWFMGVGIGYYHSGRDEENMYPLYATGHYTFKVLNNQPYVEARCGIVYDPYWVRMIQAYGALGAGIIIYNGIQVGIRTTVFSRPSRFFTANAAVVISYAFGK